MYVVCSVSGPAGGTGVRSEAASEVYERQLRDGDWLNSNSKHANPLISPGFCREAVSCAHLRAHETQAHLVCRFLL